MTRGRANPIAKTEILVVDDSASARERLRAVIESDPSFRVSTAADPFDAAESLKKSVPAAIVLDVEMPRMDGLTFLRKLMRQHPLPVVLCTSHYERGLSGLELGAIEVLAKPDWRDAGDLDKWSARLLECVRRAIESPLNRRRRLDARSKIDDAASSASGETRLTADAILPRVPFKLAGAPTERLIVVGASTGGVQAVHSLLAGIPPNCPGIVIVQHMPAGFTTAFARRLDADPANPLKVVEATNGELVESGHAYVIPGNLHGLIRRAGLSYRIELVDGPPVTRHRPSVDVLFRSAAQAAGPRAVGILLTGMLSDGAQGLAEMLENGSHTIAQDQASSVVFGMPKEAIRLGAAREILPLDRIAAAALAASK